MSRHGHRLLLLLLLALFFLPRYTATAQEGWKGDLSKFLFEGSALKLKPDGSSGAAAISKDFSALDASSYYWQTTARFTRKPSSLNTFRWTLFSVTSASGKVVRYAIAPDADGRNVELLALTYDSPLAQEPSGAVYLDGLQVLSPSASWESLRIEAFLTPEKGLSFSISSDVQSVTFSYDYPIDHGAFEGEMGLFARYTSAQKETMLWDIPTVSKLSERLPLLAYTDIDMTDDGQIFIRLNKPVSARDAAVTAPGFSPTLSQPEEDLLAVNLGGEPEEEGEFTVTITGLIDKEGRSETLEITLEAKKSDSPGGEGGQTIPAPNGIYLSELMVDPPASGLLRGLRYIEIYNGSSSPVSLGSLTLRYRTQDFPLSGGALQPGAYALILPRGTALAAAGTKVYLDAFPALSGDFPLKLIDAATEKELDCCYFSARSYDAGGPNKGFSIERVSFDPPLWRTSTAPEGGTPLKGTAMRPFSRIPEEAVILSELLLSGDKAERFIEFRNVSRQDIDLSDIYLAHRTAPDGVFTPERLSSIPHIIPPEGYAVLTPDTIALRKAFPDAPANVLVEKADFPALPTAYAELQLRAYRDDLLIDRALYRQSRMPREGRSLERKTPAKDGIEASSWGVSALKATPGSKNQPAEGLQTDSNRDHTEWPDDPVLSLEQLQALLPLHRERAALTVYSLVGQTLLEAHGDDAEKALRDLTAGTVPLPSMLILIKAAIRHPGEDAADPEAAPPLTYTSVWNYFRK